LKITLTLWIIWHYYPRNMDAKNAWSLSSAPPSAYSWHDA
jgi:hypothetical protein